MDLNSKGFYFSLDALMALMILSAAISLVFRMYAIESSGPPIQEGENVLLNGVKQPVGDMNSSANYSNPDKSVLVAVRNRYERGETVEARNIASQYFGDRGYEVSLRLTNRTDSALVYNTSYMQQTAEVRADSVYLPYREGGPTYYNSARMVVWN